MSVFSLLEVSKIFSKDQRTIRRWCEKRLIPGAYRTKGGHWRIRAKKIYFIKPRVDGFSRDRSGLSKADKKLSKQSKRGAFKAIMAAVDELVQNEQLASLVGYDDLGAASWAAVERVPSVENHELIKTRAVTLWVRRAVERGAGPCRP
jgi:hypothetical protein